MRFKVGQIIMVKSLAWFVDTEEGRKAANRSPTFISSMRKYCGKKAKITRYEVHGSTYRISIDDGDYCWGEDYLHNNDFTLNTE